MKSLLHKDNSSSDREIKKGFNMVIKDLFFSVGHRRLLLITLLYSYIGNELKYDFL